MALLSSLTVPVALTFGGCCSNVFSLEAVLRQAPQVSSFLTFIQFAFVTLQTLPGQLTFVRRRKVTQTDGEVSTIEDRTWLPRLKDRKVPLKRWAVQVILFLSVSWLNNLAFSYNVPVALHIIFRSGGLAVSMLVNRIVQGRRYAPLQVLSVLLVSAGVILATLSAPPRRSSSSSPTAKSPSASDVAGMLGAIGFDLQYLVGIGLLLLALVLSAFMGIWQEGTFRRHGDCWKEGLFYSHFLSLPFFLPIIPSLPSTLQTLNVSPPLQLSLSPFLPSALLSSSRSSFSATSALASFLEPKWLMERLGLDLVISTPLPTVWLALAANVVTQAVCVGGVNRLTSKVTSLTTSLVLTLRKAVSLVLSVWWFSGFDSVGWGLVSGGGLVLLGTLLYSVSADRKPAAAIPKSNPKSGKEM